jgi:predicted AlkP superfamily pyrophosphatase or phosphodiesterase
MRWMILSMVLLVGAAVAEAAEPQAKYVIAISVDGLRPDAITKLGPKKAPAFHFLMKNGAYTFNARTDADYTVTLPNHTAMLTGRGVNGKAGHNYTENGMPKKSLHKNKGSYIHSIFDVAHDAGLKTALVAAKAKFIVYTMSWGKGGDGAPDKTGKDNGTQKIDVADVQNSDPPTIQSALKTIRYRPNFMFIHFRGTDSTGHKRGWMSEEYLKEVQNRDADVGKILKAIRSDATLAKNTVVILTADHGGSGRGHSSSSKVEHYIIPFFAWGVGVAPGKNLYALNPTRTDPGQKQIPYSAAKQPIRNGDIANLAARLLGLPAVPGSFIGPKLDLKTK